MKYSVPFLEAPSMKMIAEDEPLLEWEYSHTEKPKSVIDRLLGRIVVVYHAVTPKERRFTEKTIVVEANSIEEAKEKARRMYEETLTCT